MSALEVTQAQEKNGTVMKCSECKFWKKSEKGSAGWRNGLGWCTNVPNFYAVSSEVEDYDPEDGEAGGLVFKPEFAGVKAVGLDASGYQAYLLTAPNFGCVSFIQKA
ncbi:hypothetical protein V8Z74_14590 [Comamonas sp. w2-DMI]|uniref:hypothetical protein n=1 Tax=Comamonas sp. w2-DMI TaxID=3126391 RepID=UPI0032E49417